MRAIFRHDFDPSILREYDIRGIVGQTLTENDAYALGVVFASVLRERGLFDVLTGYDGRLTSPAFEASLVAGLVRGGMSVGRLPCCSTPALYHASYRYRASGAIMVTGSHNPLNFNGFKFVLENRPYFGTSLLELGERSRLGVECPELPGPEPCIRTHAIADYVDALCSGWSGSGRPLRVVWDNANSSAGPVIAALVAKLPGEHLILNGTVDGRFPAHHPDPTLPENMDQLRTAVAEMKADLGVGFDGDADRLGVIDDNGTLVSADKLSLLFAQSVLQTSPGSVILGDVKMSSTVFDGIDAWGGHSRMCPSGHSEVKSALSETGGLFAGEMSGHFFFADRWPGFDDGIYAAIRLISLLSRQAKPLSSLCDTLPTLIVTPEIRFDCPDAVKFSVIDRLIARSAERGDDMTLIDGLRVTTPEGWWLLRASNTQPALVARVEGKTVQDCRTMLLALGTMLEEEGVIFPQFDEADFQLRQEG